MAKLQCPFTILVVTLFIAFDTSHGHHCYTCSHVKQNVETGMPACDTSDNNLLLRGCTTNETDTSNIIFGCGSVYLYDNATFYFGIQRGCVELTRMDPVPDGCVQQDASEWESGTDGFSKWVSLLSSQFPSNTPVTGCFCSTDACNEAPEPKLYE